MKTLLRYFHTLRYLRPRQLFYQLYYRLRRLFFASSQVQGIGSKSNVRLTASNVAPEEEPDFTFLNKAKKWNRISDIDWNCADYGKLWTYNLNYFEYLTDLPTATGRQLIDHWIDREGAIKDGWEPYPTSLRLVSWLRFYKFDRGGTPPHVLGSLRRQYRSLRQNKEYHLGGNHLLENALALVATAAFFELGRGLERSGRLLTTQLKEQYLTDGAHYELSPMYHLILAGRALIVYEGLLRCAPAANSTAALLAESLAEQLGWLNAFCTTDGRYAHFNDSTPGIAPGPGRASRPRRPTEHPTD